MPVGIPVSGDDAVRLRRQWSRALTDREAAAVVDLDLLGTDDDVAHDYAITTPRHHGGARRHRRATRINLHAGAVADDAGRALAVIGPSGSGKTTAIALLATRLGYLSDETVSLDDDLLVHPHPKPLSVITDVDAPRLKQSLSPDDLGLRHPPARAHLHRIVLLHRGDDDAGLVPVARRPARSPRSSSRPRRSSSSSTRSSGSPSAIDACGGVWALHYREFGDRLDDLVALLDRAPREPDEPASTTPASPASPPTPCPAPGRGHRGSTPWSTTTSWC